jgi:hypothetical protein
MGADVQCGRRLVSVELPDSTEVLKMRLLHAIADLKGAVLP